tara:strand:- start:2610 stop:2813 length:204 start_codon:yes stop_codon:yes gene_type:complete
MENDLDQPFAQKIGRQYGLGNSNAVRKALDVLLDKQLIHLKYSTDGKRIYKPSNPFLTNWIRGFAGK